MRMIDADQMAVDESEAYMSAQVQITDDLKWLVNFAAHSKIQKLISDTPTVDAVEVVRCRECKHRYTEDCPMYFHASYWHEGYEEYVDDDTDHTEDDYFCQEGEREEGADNEP